MAFLDVAFRLVPSLMCIYYGHLILCVDGNVRGMRVVGIRKRALSGWLDSLLSSIYSSPALSGWLDSLLSSIYSSPALSGWLDIMYRINTHTLAVVLGLTAQQKFVSSYIS